MIVLGISVFILSFNKQWFWYSLLSMVFVGLGQGFGDSVIEGFAKAFSPDVVAMKVIGYVWSGVFAAGYYLILKFAKLNPNIAFCSLYFLLIVYYFLFLQF